MKKLTTAFVTIALCASAAVAGIKTVDPLYVDALKREARGSLNDARQGPGDDFIGCSVGARTGYGPTLECVANQKQAWVYCWSRDPGLISVAQAMNNDAYLYFEWDANNECQFLASYNWSSVSPKQP